jgi:hypothetical protein
MAIDTSPVDFISLFGIDGLGWLVGIRDNTTDLNARKNAINRAYIELAGLIKGYWRRRSFDYTSSSSPALTAGTRAYNVPTTAGAVFDTIGRLYYRQSGVPRDVKVLGDSEWIERSATRTADAGYPEYARIVQTSSATQLELNRAVNQQFIDSIGTLTMEYHIAVAPLVNDTDTTILPRNLVPQILPLAGWYFAVSQGDHQLANQLSKEADRARANVLRHDLTRTGRPRQLRPMYNYQGVGRRSGRYDYGET